MNDLFFKFIEKLGSIDNTLLFAVSICLLYTSDAADE